MKEIILPLIFLLLLGFKGLGTKGASLGAPPAAPRSAPLTSGPTALRPVQAAPKIQLAKSPQLPLPGRVFVPKSPQLPLPQLTSIFEVKHPSGAIEIFKGTRTQLEAAHGIPSTSKLPASIRVKF